MKVEDRTEFSQVIRATFDNYGRQAPLPETLRVWWASLEPYGIQEFRMACLAHIRREPKFPPTIAQLLELLGHREPGRIGAEEAWSRAVLACDESETVVMNDEIAQAWGVAKPIMDLGDEVGARMAFKEAYLRITSHAAGPVKWWPSIGNDPHKRDIALAEAKRAGLLPAAHVQALLPPPLTAATKGKGEPEGLARLKAEVAKLEPASVKLDRIRESRLAEERRKTAERKQYLADSVKNHPEARV